METVELRGLKYNPVLQDDNSGFSIVLTSVLKSKVSPDSSLDEPLFLFLKLNITFHSLTD